MKNLIGLLAAALLLCGCAKKDADKLTIGVSIPSATHGWAGGIVWNAEQAAKAIEAENPDIKVIVTAGQNTSEQADRLENLITRKVDALVLLCQEPEPLTPLCERAKSKDIYLVVVSNPLSKPVQDLFVNGDNRSFGSAAADAMGQVMNGKGDIVVMEGIPCPINTERVTAFREVLKAKYPAIRILDSQPANWNTERGMTLMENYLQKYPKIDGMWAGDDDVLIGALKGYQDSKRTDIKAMVGGGGSKVIVKRILDNDPLVRATVTYSPKMIEVGMREALKGLRNGKKPLNGVKEIQIPSEVVVHENAAKYYFPNSVY